jgi:hypothetical protein
VHRAGRRSAAPAPRDPRASAATRHDNLLAVCNERREVDELELRLPRRSAGVREGIRDTRARLQAIQTWPTHRADDVDEDLRRFAPAAPEAARAT